MLSSRREIFTALGATAGASCATGLIVAGTALKAAETPVVGVSLLDFVPSNIRADIQQRKSTMDVSSPLRTALQTLAKQGGGRLNVPSGQYQLNSPVIVPRNITIYGENRAASVFKIGHSANAFSSLAGVNDRTEANIELRSIGIHCLDSAQSRGAAYYDRGGMYVHVSDVWISGFRDAIVFDQTELGDIDLCQIEYQHRSGVWLVNGPDLSLGAATNYTNRISVSRCQLNQNGDFCIVDDGGFAHAFRDNNYNGGSQGHIRIAGYTQAIVDGGEFESSGGASITLSNTTADAQRNVGRPESVVVRGGLYAMGKGLPAIKIEGVSSLTLTGNLFDGSPGSTSVAGAHNAEFIDTMGNRIRRGKGPLGPQPFFGAERAYGRHQSTEEG